MDRRSWLWRRKSSEKSPSGEIESAGSVSSHSERFSDDQALSSHEYLSSHNIQSPEVTSKAVQGDELDDTVKTLSEKLSQALDNIRTKEDLVKQHAKVAEEAVSGWERAENEVSAVKKQNESLRHKNSSLEERIYHLDGALKECLRQLRQARDKEDEKIQDSVAKKGHEWESENSELENQLASLRSALVALEKQNSDLRLELISRGKELDLRTHEQDLSTCAAETASKQHLESIKRVARLEAECRRLKAIARKATAAGTNSYYNNSYNDHRPVTASSTYMDSSTDSQADSGERMLGIENEGFKVDRQGQTGHFEPQVEIGLMDDFLEMERLAAMPEACVSSQENDLRDKLEDMVRRTSELEENLRNVTAEKVNLEIALDACREQLKLSQAELRQTEKEVESMKIKFEKSSKLLAEAELGMGQIGDQLREANEAKKRVMVELEDAKVQKLEANARLEEAEIKLKSSGSSIFTLEKEVEKEQRFSQETVGRCNALEAEISRMKADSQIQRRAMIEEFRINQEKELAEAASKFSECQKSIASIDRQLKSLAKFEDLMMDNDQHQSVAVFPL